MYPLRSSNLFNFRELRAPKGEGALFRQGGGGGGGAIRQRYTTKVVL